MNYMKGYSSDLGVLGGQLGYIIRIPGTLVAAWCIQ